MTPLSKKRQKLLLLFLVASTLLLAALIFTDWMPFLRGPAPETSEWYWPYSLRPLSHWWPAILVAGALWLVAAWWLGPEKTNRHRNALALVSLILTSLLFQITIIYADRSNVAAELVDRTLSSLASGFFEPAAEIENMAAVLRDYPQEMTTFASEHAQTHPPGLIVANWFTIQTLSRWPAFAEYIAQSVRPLRCTDLWLLDRPPEVAAALGLWSILPLLAAAVVIIPAYGLARLLLHGRARRLAAVLAAIIPALLLFSPKSVQLYALLALILFWAFQSAITRGSYGRFLLAGTLISLMTYLTLGNAVLFPLLFFYAVLYQWKIIERRSELPLKTNKWLRLLKQLLLFSLGSASFWLLAWLFWGVPPWAIAQVGLQQHYNLVTNLRRYDWWVIWNLIDLILFAGWPLLLGFLGSIVIVVRAWRQNKIAALDVLALCLLLLIILLDISGSARGEVGRIWLFFIPLLAYPAAHFWSASLPGKHQARIIVALQLLIVISLGMSWRPVRAVIVEAQRPTIPVASPDVNLDLAFTGEPFSLRGFSLQPDPVQAGEEIELTLFWEADGPAQRPYTVFTHLTNETGDLVAQQDNWPVNGQWPPTCWQAGEWIVDPYIILLPDDLPEGSYNLDVGLYDSKTGARIFFTGGEDAYNLGTIVIPAQ